MAFSLFGEKQHLRHIEDEQQAANELFVLLSDAREIYKRDVVSGGKIYRRFVDDFVYSHRYISCNRVACMNCHEMNIHIVKGLLNDCSDLVKSHFISEAFTFDTCVELRRLYDTVEAPSLHIGFVKGEDFSAPLSFGCNFTQRQLEVIVGCANTFGLFCNAKIVSGDMEALFTCRQGFHIRVNNIRRVALLFDALHEYNLIQWNWQSILSKGKFLLKKDGSKFLSTSNLSAAVSDTRGSNTSVAFGIRRAVARLKE